MAVSPEVSSLRHDEGDDDHMMLAVMDGEDLGGWRLMGNPYAADLRRITKAPRCNCPK